MPYTVHQAKTHFSKLLKAAEAGEEVVVMRGKKPVAKIVSINENASTKSAEPELPFRLAGLYAGKIHWDEDAFNPMTDQELIDCGWGYMLDAPLVSQSDKPSKK